MVGSLPEGLQLVLSLQNKVFPQSALAQKFLWKIKSFLGIESLPLCLISEVSLAGL